MASMASWLTALFSTATNWSDVRPDWPAEPIQRFSPGTDSGTFDYFVEAIMAPANQVDGAANVEAGEKAILESEGTQFSEDDNVLVQGVEGSPYAIGYFGYAYFQENQGALKALSVGGVEPTVTDAYVTAGLCSPDNFLGGEMRVDGEAAQVAIDTLATRLDLSMAETADNLPSWEAAL